MFKLLAVTGYQKVRKKRKNLGNFIALAAGAFQIISLCSIFLTSTHCF